MRILVLGGDGYLGWPTATYFSARDHDVLICDNLSKRHLETQLGFEPLFPNPSLQARAKTWRALSGKPINYSVGDLLNHRYIYHQLETFLPDAIIHYAEQPSAPYSMLGREQAVFTQQNNVIGTLNLMFAMQHSCPDAHLIKLGTMGEYGTPNIDIEEGFLEVTHNGRTMCSHTRNSPAPFTTCPRSTTATTSCSGAAPGGSGRPTSTRESCTG